MVAITGGAYTLHNCDSHLQRQAVTDEDEAGDTIEDLIFPSRAKGGGGGGVVEGGQSFAC